MSIEFMTVARTTGKIIMKTIVLFVVTTVSLSMSLYSVKVIYNGNKSQSNEKLSMWITRGVVRFFGCEKGRNTDISFADPISSLIATNEFIWTKDLIFLANDPFEKTIVKIFLVCMMIITIQFLRSLSVNEKHVLLAEAADVKKKISIIKSYETFFSYFNFSPISWLIFPDISAIVIFPNKDTNRAVEKFAI